jgi:hypothetical protein
MDPPRHQSLTKPGCFIGFTGDDRFGSQWRTGDKRKSPGHKDMRICHLQHGGRTPSASEEGPEEAVQQGATGGQGFACPCACA